MTCDVVVGLFVVVVKKNGLKNIPLSSSSLGTPLTHINMAEPFYSTNFDGSLFKIHIKRKFRYQKTKGVAYLFKKLIFKVKNIKCV